MGARRPARRPARGRWRPSPAMENGASSRPPHLVTGVCDSGHIRDRCLNGAMTQDFEADVIVVGAGLAGLVATARAGRRRQQGAAARPGEPSNLGGQAFWSLGGLFLVDTPEQRRMGIKDSYELALQDWLGSAGFDRDRRGPLAAPWAEAYVEFAAGEKRAWLHDLGLRVVPGRRLGRARRRRADGHGNSVPRFHLTWGTGPGVVAPSSEPVLRGREARAGHVRVPAPRRRADRQGRRRRRRPRHGARSRRRWSAGVRRRPRRGRRVRVRAPRP